MKKIFLMILPLLLENCKCQTSSGPEPKPYQTMAISKDNGAFIAQYIPQLPFFVINGKKYFIEESWLEHPHLQRDFHDYLTQDTCIVINISDHKDDSTDLKQYIKEDGNGLERVWVTFPWSNDPKDSVVIYYRETLESKKKDKTLVFFRR